MYLRALASLFICIALSACAAAPQTSACGAGMRPMKSDLLYFGTAGSLGTVTPAQWANFLETVVTPQFPDGLSVWQATGQWRAPGNEIVHEDSYVLNVVHDGSGAAEQSFATIIAAYKERFRQESVLRVQAGVCTNLGEDAGP